MLSVQKGNAILLDFVSRPWLRHDHLDPGPIDPDRGGQ